MILKRTATFKRQFRSSWLRGTHAGNASTSVPSSESIKFWKDAAKDIDWIQPCNTIFSSKGDPFSSWFPQGSLNLCYNAVDRHVLKGRGDAVALIYDSPVTATIRKVTYSELQTDVEAMSALFQNMGVLKGDRVLIYMPNMPETIVAMLACVRIGAIHSVVFGGFAASEIATRIKDCKPKIIVCTSCGLEGSKVVPYKEYVDAAIKLANGEHTVQNTLVLQRSELPNPDMEEGRDLFWKDAIKPFLHKKVPCVPMMSTDPSYILYTSGTTGQPKGVLRDTGGYAVALRWSMSEIFATGESDVFWAASDVGWVVGHSYTAYGPLLRGCTSVIYEGKPVGTPDAANFWRTIARHRVNALFTAPTALRAIKREDPHGALVSNFDTSSLRTLFLAGERADSDSIKWAEKVLRVPVRDHWWQTETGWPMCANMVGREGYLPIKYGSVFRAVPGYDLRVVNEENKEVGPNTIGALVVKLPLPPGCFQTLYNNDARFVDAYFKRVPGFYNTGDDGLIDENGYVSVMSRHDDVINVAGHRISTGAIEEVCDPLQILF